MTTAKDGDVYDRLVAAMREAAAAGKGKKPLDWAREFGVERHLPYDIAAKLGIIGVLKGVRHAIAVDHVKGSRARLGHRFLTQAFGEKLRRRRQIHAHIFPPDGEFEGAILFTLGK